jgi:hypothetical protein
MVVEGAGSSSSLLPEQPPPSEAAASETAHSEVAAASERACSEVSEEPGEDRTCVVCLTAPRDAGLVHGGTVHICCCRDCAEMLQKRGQGCPMCRAPIDVVLRAFS